MKFDVIVVGARCAGAATALLLARAGVRVLVVDRGVHGTDTLSTHALMRGAVLQLHRWGVLPAIVAAGTPPVHSTTFSYTTQDVTVPIEPRYGVSALYAPRRLLLDRVLVDAAARRGAEIRYGVRVEDVFTDASGRVRGIVAASGGVRERIEADVVVGADGLYSTIAQRVDAPYVARARHSTGVLYSYWEGLPADGYNWRFHTAASTGTIPTNDGATCVFVAVPASKFRDEVHGNAASAYRALLRQSSSAFDARLDDARMVEPVRGFGGHVGFIKAGAGPGWALVGDAGYFKDPLTAHGITDALRDAEFLARAIVRGTSAAFTEYEETRHALSRRLFELTDEIASLDWTDEGVQALHRAFSSEMSREVRALAALEPMPSVANSATVLAAPAAMIG
jgi:menaquinone-9 beta-reductase